MSSIWWALNWIGSQFSTQRRLQLWLSIAPHLRRLMLYPLELRAHRVKLWPLLLAEDKAVLPADPSPIASGVRRSAAHRCPAQLGGISQAALCRTRPGLDLSLPLARATGE